MPTGSAGSRPGASAAPPGSPIYLDLAYLPSGGSARLVDEEFFRRVRALCYVISGQDQRKEEGMRAVLDALLAGKRQWDRDLQVRAPPGLQQSGRKAGPAPAGVFLLNPHGLLSDSPTSQRRARGSERRRVPKGTQE